MKISLCLALVGLGTALALAQQPADPLAPYRIATWRGDGRLAKRMTVEVLGRPLRDTLKQLSQVSGVSLRVSRECAEWRAVLCVKETSLADVLAGIAYAFDLSWRAYSTGKDKPPGYELYQSPAQKERQEDLFQGRALRLRDVLMQAIPRAQSLQQRGAHPPLPNISFPITRQQAIDWCVHELMQMPHLLPALSPLGEQEMLRLFLKYPVYLPAERFTPAQRQILAPENTTVYVRESPDAALQPQQISQRLLGVVWVFHPTLGLLEGMVLTRSEERTHTTRIELNILDYGASTAIEQEDNALDRLLSPQERKRSLPGETLPSQGLSVPQRLCRLAQMAPVQVVAEYYPLGMSMVMVPVGQTAEQALQVLFPYYRVTRAGDLLLFRSRYPALDRLSDIPQPLLDRWLGSNHAFGLTLDTIREIDATLSHYQREEFSQWCSDMRAWTVRQSPARSVFWDLMFEATEGDGRLLVRLLSFLPVAQQTQVLAGQRLTLPASPAVMETLAELQLHRARWGGNFDLPVNAPVWLQGKRTSRRCWGYDGASLQLEGYVRLEDMWLSTPNESFAGFQKRLRQAYQELDESRWLEVEEEEITLQLGAGDETIAEHLLRLARFRRLPLSQ
ncbi:MAG: hypothetical protein ACP5RN_11070 [Armatimonadota bacterium]